MVLFDDVAAGFVRAAGGNEAFHFTLGQAPRQANGGVTAAGDQSRAKGSARSHEWLCAASLLTRVLHFVPLPACASAAACEIRNQLLDGACAVHARARAINDRQMDVASHAISSAL